MAQRKKTSGKTIRSTSKKPTAASSRRKKSPKKPLHKRVVHLFRGRSSQSGKVAKKRLKPLALIAFAAIGSYLVVASMAATPSCPTFKYDLHNVQINFDNISAPTSSYDGPVVQKVDTPTETREYYYHYSGPSWSGEHQIDSISPTPVSYRHSDNGSVHGISMDYSGWTSNPVAVTQPSVTYRYKYYYNGRLYVKRTNKQTGQWEGQQSNGGASVAWPLTNEVYRWTNGHTVKGPVIGPCRNDSQSTVPQPNTPSPSSPQPANSQQPASAVNTLIPERIEAQTEDGQPVSGVVFNVFVRDNSGQVVDRDTRSTPVSINSGGRGYGLVFSSAPAHHQFLRWKFPDGHTVAGADTGEFATNKFDNQTIIIVLKYTPPPPPPPSAPRSTSAPRAQSSGGNGGNGSTRTESIPDDVPPPSPGQPTAEVNCQYSTTAYDAKGQYSVVKVVHTSAWHCRNVLHGFATMRNPGFLYQTVVRCNSGYVEGHNVCAPISRGKCRLGNGSYIETYGNGQIISTTRNSGHARTNISRSECSNEGGTLVSP